MKKVVLCHEKMNWLAKLQTRWKLENTTQVVLVLIVFACTGTTVLFIKKPIFALLGIDYQALLWWQKAIYYLLVLPIYQLLLLGYGWIFGQFNFFLEFEKKTFRRIFRIKA